jgi:hypothetical protein
MNSVPGCLLEVALDDAAAAGTTEYDAVDRPHRLAADIDDARDAVLRTPPEHVTSTDRRAR